MSARVTVRVVQGPGPGKPDTTAVAVKIATTAEQVDRLADEAERLRTFRHPSVVAYVDHRETNDRAELHTLYAGEPLALWRGSREEAAGTLAALAASLAELHALGLVHGRIDPSHVLLEPGGRPVLCGLSPPPLEATPADDVAALGRLLDQLTQDLRQGKVDPSGPRRGWGRPGRPPGLGMVIDHATDPEPGRRPTARALSCAILDAVPGALLPDGDAASSADESEILDRVFVDQRDTGEEEVFIDRGWDSHLTPGTAERPPWALRGRTAVLAAAVVLAGVTLGVRSLTTQPTESTSNHPPADESASAADRTSPACTSREDGSSATVDVTGDGCLDEVVIQPGGVIQVGNERWAVGTSGDDVAVGDWDCDGTATPAVFRPSTGEVFVFSHWASEDAPVTIPATTSVPAGVGLAPAEPAAGEDGCDIPVVISADGSRTPVEVQP